MRSGCGLDDALAIEVDGAGAWDHAGDGTQRCGLAGTIGAEDHGHLALLHVEIDAVQHLDRPVAGRQTANREQRAHTSLPR